MEENRRLPLHEGKGKVLYPYGSGWIEFWLKPAIGAFDDPQFTKQFPEKPALSLRTIVNCFKLLGHAGIPVAFQEAVSETTYIGHRCDPLPVEVIVRTQIDPKASLRKRMPHLPVGVRLPRLIVEYHLKTTDGVYAGPEGVIVMPVVDGKAVNDPLMEFVDEEVLLFHPKLPGPEPILRVPQDKVFKDERAKIWFRESGIIDAMARKCGLVLEGAWRMLGWTFVDLKLEFGVDDRDVIRVIDGVSNDEQRLRDPRGRERSKQAFRDNPEDVAALVDHYKLVADMTDRWKELRAPRIIVWRGSESDEWEPFGVLGDPTIRDALATCEVGYCTLSAHKEPDAVLSEMRRLAHSNQPTVIIAYVGLSDALSALIAANGAVPVIKVSPSGSADDILSSMRLPSRQTPPNVVWKAEGALRAALTILSQHDPVLYMHLQNDIEARTLYPMPRMHTLVGS